jgi:hypothetical protein
LPPGVVFHNPLTPVVVRHRFRTRVLDAYERVDGGGGAAVAETLVGDGSWTRT